MTTRPCAIFICCAYAAPDSDYCPAHALLQAEGKLNAYTGKLSKRRGAKARQAHDDGAPNANAWLPLANGGAHQTE